MSHSESTSSDNKHPALIRPDYILRTGEIGDNGKPMGADHFNCKNKVVEAMLVNLYGDPLKTLPIQLFTPISQAIWTDEAYHPPQMRFVFRVQGLGFKFAYYTKGAKTTVQNIKNTLNQVQAVCGDYAKPVSYLLSVDKRTSKKKKTSYTVANLACVWTADQLKSYADKRNKYAADQMRKRFSEATTLEQIKAVAAHIPAYLFNEETLAGLRDAYVTHRDQIRSRIAA